MFNINRLYHKISEKVDVPFLIFLVTICSNKVYLKVVALVLIFALRPRFNFVFNKNIPLFYPLIIILTTVQFLLFGNDFSAHHLLVFGIGIFYWFMCYAFMYQTYLFVNGNMALKINNSLSVFAVINFAACIVNYFIICIKAHTLFPFLQYDGPYGASTGDYIGGLFGVPSYINAIVNVLLALYFLHRNKMGLFMIVTICALMSFANIINIIYVFVLVIYAIFAADNRRRLFIALNVMLCFLMYFYVSPDNYNYLRKTIGLSVYNQREIMPEVVMEPGDESHSTSKARTHVRYVNDSSAARQTILMLDRDEMFGRTYDQYVTYSPVDIKASPGKKIAIQQTVLFLKANPSALFFGAGIGNFSSRLAFQFSGRDSSRLFMKLPKYCHGYYFQNNLLIYDSMRQLPGEYHSIKHFPNNFISQLLGEYGLIGLVLFLVFYLYFFYRRVNDKTFFLILLVCTSGFLILDYFFEFFSVMVFFEMILFIDMKDKKEDKLAKTNE